MSTRRANRAKPRSRHRPATRAIAAADPLEVTIRRIGPGGAGVADGPEGPLIVPFTAAGDRIRVQPGEAYAGGRMAALLQVLEPGPARVEPPCPHFGRCGGCALQHVDEAVYAAWKRERLARALARVGLSDCELAPMHRTPPRARRRATFAAIRRGTGPAVIGFNVGRSTEIVDLATCVVLNPAIVGLLPILRRLLAEVLPARGRADVAVARLEDGLDVVVEWPQRPGADVRQRLADFAAEADLVRLSWRAAAGRDPEPIAERRAARARFGATTVAVPAGGFLQASAEGEAALVAGVLDALQGAGRIADMFCGCGTFSLPVAAAGAQVHAVDSDAAAVAALRAAARTLPRSFGVVSVEARDLYARPLAPVELQSYEAVVFDPPRSGAQRQAAALAASRVPVVVAVSCNPESFARDARILADGGLRLQRVTPVDQFLWSPHLELVAVFRRTGADVVSSRPLRNTR